MTTDACRRRTRRDSHGRARAAVLLLCAQSLAAPACEGPAGPAGRSGEPRAGAPGPAGERGPKGEPGERDAGSWPADAGLGESRDHGLFGFVRDPTEHAVGSGRVLLVPADAVAELSAQAIDLELAPADAAASGVDEPLEDVIDAEGDNLPQASVGGDGAYAFEAVPDGDWFVVWVPEPDDVYHLPGGQASRQAFSHESLNGSRLDLRVSGSASRTASYVGSSRCITCHGKTRFLHTAHRIGLGVPGAPGTLQRTGNAPRLDALLAEFERGTTLYFSDCSRDLDSPGHCQVTQQDPTPSAELSFSVELRREPALELGMVGALSVTLHDAHSAETVSYPVVLRYGGVLTRQQLIVRAPDQGGGFTHHVLPFTYNLGGDARAAERADWPFSDYYSERWYDAARERLRSPEVGDAFENQCAGCHFTGYQLSGDPAQGWQALAVSSAEGEYDLDGDGRAEEINVGCESCHGPGSEHLESSPRGSRIVSPGLLTPERALLICGACHSRPVGLRGAGAEAPLDADGAMPRPGMRRADYLRAHTRRIDAEASDYWPSGDARRDRQEYADFLRSTKARNGRLLMVCENCHDPHGSDDHPHDLAASSADNSVCTACHADSSFVQVHDHVGRATSEGHLRIEAAELHCSQCHMVPTAQGGARRFALLDDRPATATPLQYYHGDTASHRFRIQRRDEAGAQPAPVTQPCASFCHAEFLPNP